MDRRYPLEEFDIVSFTEVPCGRKAEAFGEPPAVALDLIQSFVTRRLRKCPDSTVVDWWRQAEVSVR